MYNIEGLATGNNCRRSSRRSKRTKTEQKRQVFIANPLKGHNYLPTLLKEQIQPLQFLSQKTINSINYEPNIPKNCYFSDNLTKMKLAAQNQELKIKNFNKFGQLQINQLNLCPSGFIDIRHLLSQHITNVQPMDKQNHINQLQMDIESKTFDIFSDNYQEKQQAVSKHQYQQVEDDQLFY